MEGTCKEKGSVIGVNLTFGLFRYKTRGSCVYNETDEKKGSLCSFLAWYITCKLMR